MKWTRTRPGAYASGPYTVVSADTHRPLWYATGPRVGTDIPLESKTAAQRACERAAIARLLGEGQAECQPVLGDAVLYAGRRGTISALMTTNDGQPLYCLRLARGKRQCLLRSEFEVVLP